MDQIICLNHPYYNGTEQPELTCTTCCKIFVDELKRCNADRRLPLKIYAKSNQKVVASLPHLKVSNYCPVSL